MRVCVPSSRITQSTRITQFNGSCQLALTRCYFRLSPLMSIGIRGGQSGRSDVTLPDQLRCGIAYGSVSRSPPTSQHYSPVAQGSKHTRRISLPLSPSESDGPSSPATSSTDQVSSIDSPCCSLDDQRASPEPSFELAPEQSEPTSRLFHRARYGHPVHPELRRRQQMPGLRFAPSRRRGSHSG